VSSGFGVWLRDLVISLAISAFIIIFLYQPVKVEGTSMMPSLVDQERIFVNKFVYRLEPIERGDIVVFRYPYDPSKSYIKRVTVWLTHPHRCPQVSVNGAASTRTMSHPNTSTRTYREVVVPPEPLRVLGTVPCRGQPQLRPGGSAPHLREGCFGYWPVDKLGRAVTSTFCFLSD
jgi:signal peptidase I